MVEQLPLCQCSDLGDSQPFSGDSQPFSDDSQPFSGDSQPFPGDSQPFSGDSQPFPGDSQPFPGDFHPFPKSSPGFRGSASPGESPGASSPLRALSTPKKRKFLPLFWALGRGCDAG